MPPTQEKIENEAFEQDKFEARGLQLKEKYGTSAPAEQERLGVLQAKMDSFWVQRRERTKAQPNLLEILTRKGRATPATAPAAPIQPKLAIGQPNDHYEQEADRVAEQVISMAPPAASNVQRQTEEEEQAEIQTKPLAETITPMVQRLEASEDEEPVQTKCEVCEGEEQIQRSPDSVAQSQPNLESRLNSSKDGGSPLSDEVRSFMEPRFGFNFSQVRVHTNSEAVQMNRELNAQAFTHGSHIYFGEGKSPANDNLTAHEMTHVLQQTGGEQLQAKFFNLETHPIRIANSQDGWVQRYPDTILEVAQMGFAETILRLSIDQVINKTKDKKELINEAFWTAYPQMKEKKINDENVPDSEQKQTYINAYKYIQKTLYLKVEKEARKYTKSEVIVPKPNNKGIPGLPEKPQLEHPEFSAIVQEIEQMEQNSLEYEEKHHEEIGDARTERIEKIAELRKRIAALGETLSDLESSQIKSAQAYLYRRLAPLAPYYGQMANTNMLAKGSDKGWARTCNVTVPAMIVEGIGKTKDDYDQSQVPMLKRIFNVLEGKYKERDKYDDATDFDALRLPDFMALIHIRRHLFQELPNEPTKEKDKKEYEEKKKNRKIYIDSLTDTDSEFVKEVSQARKDAAETTTHHQSMMFLIEQFGGKTEPHYVFRKELETIGTAQKAYTKAELRGENPEEWRELYNEVKSGTKSLDKLNKTDKKRYYIIEDYEKFNKQKADELLSVDDYREAVLKKVNPLLDKGAQILVGMERHFVRLDALDQDTIQVDDPGEKGFKDLQVTWEQARNLGYFKNFWAITG
jgi:hypothetical protein